VDLLTTIE